MALFSRLFGMKKDPREAMRPLWHRTVELAREKAWYAERHVADTVEGRFDMITAILCVVLLRMESEKGDLAQSMVHLTELFVEDMDGQLRESGVGDMVVGKHMGRLMAALGGRLGAYRSALDEANDTTLAEAVERNLSLVEGSSPHEAAAGLRALRARLDDTKISALLAGEI